MKYVIEYDLKSFVEKYQFKTATFCSLDNALQYIDFLFDTYCISDANDDESIESDINDIILYNLETNDILDIENGEVIGNLDDDSNHDENSCEECRKDKIEKHNIN